VLKAHINSRDHPKV